MNTMGFQMLSTMKRVKGMIRGGLAAIALSICLSAGAAIHEVEIGEGQFMPDRIVIEAGDTVVWHAASPEHTVSSDDGLFDSVDFWDTIPMGEKFQYTFTEEGVFPYFCGLHGSPGGSGMAGVVVVSAAASNRPPATPTNALPVNGASEQALTPLLRSGPFSDPDPGDFHGGSQWLVRRADSGVVVFDSGDDAVGKVERIVPNGVLEQSTTYSWQVRHRDGRFAWSAYSTPTTFTTLQPVVATGIGLKASYWNGAPGGDPLASATNAVMDLNWGVGRPHRRITGDAFGARWEGYLVPEFTERHEMDLMARGAARLWVNGVLLVDEWVPCHFAKTRKAWIQLVAGQPAAVRIDYLADPAGAQVVLRWAGPSFPTQVVPTARLFPSHP